MGFYNKAKSRLKLVKMNDFKKVKEVTVEIIPTNWETFPLNSNDQWVKVVLPKTEEAISCLYKVKSDSTFLPHKHDVDEIVLIINEGGEMEMITTDGSTTVKYGDSYRVPAGVVHACEIKAGTKLMCIWLGKDNDKWEAVFPSIGIV